MAHIYFEDIEEGTEHDLGKVTADRTEMVAFAERYDPQPFHTDPAAASDSIYGELIASGWFTASLCMRQLVVEFLDDVASMGAFGVELSWPTPVRPGDTLQVSLEIVETKASESRADRGYVDNRVVAVNQQDETVLEWEGTNIIRRRD